MTRFSLPALASVSVLALGLVAAPVSFDLGGDLIGASSAWAKNGGNGHGGGQGGGQGGGHGHGQSGKSGETEVSSTDVDDVEHPEEGEDEEEAKTKTLPDTAIAGKTNSSAFNSANYAGGVGATSTTGKTPNPNSAVAYSQEQPTEDPETPEDPGTPEDPSQTPETPETPEDPNQVPQDPTAPTAP